ncbi:hypothetical protein SAMN06265222_104113 [Neorhodopirellula lusitana]|uniref:Secreted protein n=1 Tax=Neorhodopirellula lusitana TaxID=445327 RepID=A0ABY1Q0Y7_9BACT|nr:hypothetical protein [Neorhodopirellula lusitana]SMP53438.1 hypothetical protein SAMN06265222_104113 [Neorhodopirellula lusitana]
MSRILRSVIAVAALVAILSSAQEASASTIRNCVERHQHPGHGFFVNRTGHRAQHVYRRCRR